MQTSVKYKLVIFDFDGTLADSFPWFLSVVDTVADKYKFKRVAHHEIEALRTASARQIVKQLGVPWWKIPLIGRTVRRLAADNAHQITLFEGIDGVLQRLSQAGVMLAVVTANSEANVRRVLGPENAARISYYECSVPLFGKQARFRRIVKQMGIAPHEALCVGDELRDLEAARKAHIPFGAVAWGFTQLDALQAQAPDEVFVSVEQIGEQIITAGNDT